MKYWTLCFGSTSVCVAAGAVIGYLMSGAAVAQTVESGQQLQGGQSPSLAFCQERFLEKDDGLLRCNWAVNFNFACFVSYPSNKVVQVGSLLSEPEVVGECDNGERIVKILHY
ncbi:hypothetical protein [Microbulbifer sp.]|uniref:hypothetical protein n=1 Tax=Microbulbifer sp. TaxID=1908541 RepID=UPI002F922C74